MSVSVVTHDQLGALGDEFDDLPLKTGLRGFSALQHREGRMEEERSILLVGDHQSRQGIKSPDPTKA